MKKCRQYKPNWIKKQLGPNVTILQLSGWTQWVFSYWALSSESVQQHKAGNLALVPRGLLSQGRCLNRVLSLQGHLKTLGRHSGQCDTNTSVHRILPMRTLFKYLASYMTFLLKFMHLGKHEHFPCLLVSKFLMSNPNNVNLEWELKYLSCQLTHTRNSVCVWQHSQIQGSDGTTKAGAWLVGFNSCGGFSPHIQRTWTPTGL